jgi:hypothetical protein
MPAYVTLKEVKKRWGHGQEDTFPVAQFEKLWGDMTALSEVDCRFFVVPRLRGQQLLIPMPIPRTGRPLTGLYPFSCWYYKQIAPDGAACNRIGLCLSRPVRTVCI